MQQIDSMMEGEAGRTDIDSPTEIKALSSGTNAVESLTIIQSNSETEGVSEVSSPKPRICVALPQSKYPPITRIDLIEQTDFHSLRTFEESPRSEYSPYCEDHNTSEQNITTSSTTILLENPPPKPVIESPSTNTIHPLSTITSQNGVPELIQFNILMDSPKSLFTDSESSPSPMTRNDKITSLVIPSISPNPSKFERKDSRESWALYTPSELRISPLSRAQTTPHSNQHRPQTTPSFSPAGDSRFWRNLSQSNSNHHFKAGGSAPITPHNIIRHTSTPMTPTPGGLFFCERKCSLVESVISPATHELKLFQKGIQTSPLESPQTPSSDEKRGSPPPLTPGDCQVNVGKVDNDNPSCSPHLILPTNGAVSSTNGAIPPRFRNSSPCTLVITKEIQPVERSKQQQLELSPSKSGFVSPKVPLLELGPKEKSLCCCLIS